MSQISNRWPRGRHAAISLTYDDGIPNHIQLVAPQLEAHGLRGTFYAPLQSDLRDHPLEWRALAQRGHELGNHSVFHPCWGVKGKYAAWLPDQNNLVHYDAERWLDEMNTANQALALIDGQVERTFGNTCFDNYLGSEDAPVCLETLIAQLFSAARGEDTGRPVDLAHLNYNNLGTVWADRRAFGDFAGELEEILETGGWVIYTFHGVGEAAHNHHINAGEHQKLLEYLRDHRQRYWTAPVIEVVRYLKKLS
jgi:peptidoglycan/xylan/chitin deacetylase (PgdA/CDA1 family)